MENYLKILKHWAPGNSVLSVRILVGSSRKALINGSQCMMGALTALKTVCLESCYCALLRLAKIANNLSIFALSQIRWYANGTVFIALICVYVQRFYDLKI